MTPALNRSDTEAPAACAYRMKGMEGGQCHGKLLIIPHFQHDGDCHGTHGRHCGRGRTGDRPEKQAGQNGRTGDSGSLFTNEIGKNIEQLLGDPAPSHDDTGKHKEGDRQQRGLIHTAKHGPGNEHTSGGKGIRQKGR